MTRRRKKRTSNVNDIYVHEATITVKNEVNLISNIYIKMRYENANVGRTFFDYLEFHRE